MSSTINELMLCANSWEPNVCLLGNVTARDLRLFCIEFADMKRRLQQMQPVLEASKAWQESWVDAGTRPEPVALPEEAALYDAVVAWQGTPADATEETREGQAG
ncbi:MAG TPA: hypothetical protein VFS67_21730 [Polyangiaceae bacterium]|nr:hypothetical protein [Polyangiaceae bacterium]